MAKCWRTGRAAADALGLTEDELVTDVPVQVASTGLPHVYVALKDARDVDAAIPEKQRLGRVFRQAVFLFAPNGKGRLYSRMFAGHIADISEDPATGSASGPLGAFAVKYGLVRGRPTVLLVSEQGTKMGRQSFVHIRLDYPAEGDVPTSIEVGGSVVPTLKGELDGGWDEA